MNKSVLMILAISFLLPVMTRSQNEGVKHVSSTVATDKKPMYDRSTREMGLMQEQGSSGGASCPAGLSSENAACYLEPGWVPGKVMLNDNTLMDNILLRYDLYHQQLQFIRGEDTLAFAKPEEVNNFTLDGKNFIYAEYQLDNIIDKGYFEILADGNCKLLLRRTVEYHVTPETNPNLEEDLYIRECTYYISKNGETAKPVRACRSGVLCAFKDKEDQVKKFMKDNGMKMNTCEQLKEVVAYYNSLQ
jgi:hypothetical protein